MVPYEVRFQASVRKDLRRIRKEYVHKILRQIYALGSNPHPEESKKLKGEELYRIRIGVYRVIYEISDAQLLISVVKVGHRSNVYK